MNRALVYAGVGAGLSLGAPLGWLCLRHPGLADLGAELRDHLGLYTYLGVGTAAAFTAFGAVAGRLADRLAISNRELAYQAAFDALTGLRNPHTFRVELEQTYAGVRRTGQSAALIVLDLDLFKRVNDTYGHATGDLVLAQTGRVLAEVARASDAAFRIGGEEFAVLCPATTTEEAGRLAERLRATMEARTLHVGDKELRITGSFGVAVFRGEGTSDAFFRTADRALYSAKEQGRNRVGIAP